MPTKNAERIAQAAVYIDGKPIKGIQEIRPQKIKIIKSRHRRKGR